MSKEQEKDAPRKAVIGFLTTLIVAVATRLITAVMESESVEHAVSYVMTNFPFLFSALTTAVAGGYFAQKWTRSDK
jgi:hypothetical protein